MKKVLYVIIALLVVYLILAMVGPKEIKVERSISINKPSSLVVAKLGDFKFFHDEWSPWTELDPNMKTEYKGNPGEVGHLYTWDGNKEVGKGEMEIKGFNGDSLNLRWGAEGMGDSKIYYIAKNKDASTDLTWGMIFDVGFMMRPMMLFMNMDKMLGEHFEKGLATLKTKLESIKEETVATGNHEVKEVNWEERTFYGTKRTKMDGHKLKEYFAENWPKIHSELEKEKITPVMASCGLFYSWDQATMATECAAVTCIPNGKELKGYEKYSIPACKVLSVPYYGAPEKGIEAHYAVEEYMKGKNLNYSFVIEEYVINPSLEKDTTKWLTNIYYILK